jgi:hypothetical protein
MQLTTEEIRAAYRKMSDEELLGISRDQLTDTARVCYDSEVLGRGLELYAEPAEEPPPLPLDDEPLVVLGTWTADDAWRVQSVLAAADIPSQLVSGPMRESIMERATPLGPFQGFQVLVPASLVQEALDLLHRNPE